MKKINIELKYLILLWVLSILAIIVTYAHHGNLIIDNGREAYYPTQVLLGKVLYKDIFDIYGPFAYMFNALLFKFFGINLNVLYSSGVVCCLAIISLTYLISRRFLSEFISFSIGVYTIVIGILQLSLFNFIFPYSYAMLYGIMAFLASIWSLLKYHQNKDKILYLYSGCFFAGLCISNKYEFLPYLIVILYAIIKIKPLKLKEYYYSVFYLLFMPIFCFGILFLQGLTINDLLQIISYIKKMAGSQTLTYFYLHNGVYFHHKTIPLLLVNFIKTILPLSLLVYSFKRPKKWQFGILFIFSIICTLKITVLNSFVFLPVLIFLLALLNYKKIVANVPLTILTLSALIISLKSFWGLVSLSYGVFFASFLLITVLALCFHIFKDKNINPLAIGIYILIISVILVGYYLPDIKIKGYPLKTERGVFYVQNGSYNSSMQLLKYLQINTKKTDKVVILPEGALINFLADRPTDNYYTSLIPLYVEVFGDKNLIEHFKKTKPEYIVFNNWDTHDYYFKYICKDYAVPFCNYVAQNYRLETFISDQLNYLIFKRK